MREKGLSYILAVLLILGITVVAASLYALLARSQLSLILSTGRGDIDKVLEKVEVVHAIKTGPSTVDVLLYNYGDIPTCVVEAYYLAGGLQATPPCSIIQPHQTQLITLNFGGTLPSQDFSIVLITQNRNIISAEVVVP